MHRIHINRGPLVPALLCVSLLLSACGGGGGGGGSGNIPVPPAAPVLTITSNIKQLVFKWASVPGATHYRLLRNPDGASGFTQVGAYAAGVTQATLDIAVHRQDWVNALYWFEACNADRCSASTAISAIDAMVQAIGYFKASNTDAEDAFGFSLALSADGRTLAVGALGEASAATGVDGDQSSDGAQLSGAVYVFTRQGAEWLQQAYLKASNSEITDFFGRSLALSADGNTIAVGAEFEDSAATGVGNDQSNNDAAGSGAVYVFTREGVQWSQQAYVKASNTGVSDFFGYSLALSADGHTLAVSAPSEASAASGVDGDQSNDGAEVSGAVYVFTRAGEQWLQQAYVKASNTQATDSFGSALALSPDGNTLAVAAELEDSAATGEGGTQTDNSAQDSGAVYVFTRVGPQWSQQAYVKAPNTNPGDVFGSALALSADGDTLAVSARLEDSAATAVDGAQNNNGAPNAGAVYVFERNGVQWSHRTYLKASNALTGESFGSSLALSADGQTLAVGAPFEDSNAIGVGGNQSNSGADRSGAVYTFTRAGASWRQQTYVKASNTDASDFFGNAVALSADGDVLAVSASSEGSDATGVSGDQINNNADAAGAVYIY